MKASRRTQQHFAGIEAAEIRHRTMMVAKFKAAGGLLLADGMARELLDELVDLLIVEHTHEE